MAHAAPGTWDEALAGHVDLKALRHIPVLFLVYSGGEVPGGAYCGYCGIV